MSKVKYNIAIDSWRGTLDSRKAGQAKRERIVSRFRGGESHQVYPMKMHDGPWSEKVTANRELMKMAIQEAHNIEKAAKQPELAPAEYLAKANMWTQRFADYKATKKPADKQYATLFTYTYSHLYRELKLGNVLTNIAELKEHKENTYKSLIPQIQALISDESDLIANMANIAAILHNTFHFLWTGFYRVIQNKTIIVPNVHEFPGHIACSNDSKSEIVVPIRKNGEIIAVLDIDSADYNTFDSIDQKWLEQIFAIFVVPLHTI